MGSKEKNTVPFNGTPEQEKALREMIGNHKGQYKISVCLGTACYVKGSGDIFAKLSEKLGISDGKCTQDGIFSLDACRCIGACGLAPVMTVNDDVYGKLTVDEIDGILAKYTE